MKHGVLDVCMKRERQIQKRETAKFSQRISSKVVLKKQQTEDILEIVDLL
jgi:hypothetical protein